jgi:chlorite dismutase
MGDEKRQYVHFCFYKLDPAWRCLPSAEREQGKRELIAVIEAFSSRGIVIPYSLVGLRAEVDLMLWRISYELEAFQEMSAQISATGLGKYLTPVYAYLAMTKRSTYVDKHTHEGQESKRLTIVPGESKYLFVYPFVKTRAWYMLPKADRQRMMDTHISVGHKFPTVKINTSYSFGLDDAEFVLSFESDAPNDFLDLVMALRETEASPYTERDTPIFTCIRKNIKDALNDLGG